VEEFLSPRDYSAAQARSGVLSAFPGRHGCSAVKRVEISRSVGSCLWPLAGTALEGSSSSSQKPIETLRKPRAGYGSTWPVSLIRVVSDQPRYWPMGGQQWWRRGRVYSCLKDHP
jgi:hypothetical protein